MDFWENVSDFARDFFWETGELILICTAVGDAMICAVVNLAPREFFWSFFLWDGKKERR